MLPRDRAEQILAEYAAGKPIRVIAATFGHSTVTVGDYVHGRRAPGEPATRPDDFEPFAAYCRHRLADDPHLRAPALLTELSRLGLRSGRATFYRALDRHGIQPHPCPDCHTARISGYATLTTAQRPPHPSPLPLPVSPVTGETLASFLSRLSAVNHVEAGAIIEILPPWFRVKTRWHDDRWQHDQLSPWTDDAITQLATISGSSVRALSNALPAFGTRKDRPVRAVTACRRCTAARQIQQPVPAHLPGHHQVCLRHGIWLPGTGLPQFNVSECPDIVHAERQARRLLRHCTIEQLIYAELKAGHAPGDQAQPPKATHQAWKRRMRTLIKSNSRAAIESCPQALFLAAGYPEIVTRATRALGAHNASPI